MTRSHMDKYPINVNRVNKEFTNWILKFYKWAGIKLGVFHTMEEAAIARSAALQTANAIYGDTGFTELHGLSA